MDLIQQLKVLLASNFAFYLKIQYYHWNVEGNNFFEYHNFFASLYEEVYSAIDKLAEQIRTLDSYSPGSFERYLQLSLISGEDKILEAKDMITQLVSDNEIMLTALSKAYFTAEENKQLAISNFLQDRVEQHRKHGWMLKSFLKGS